MPLEKLKSPEELASICEAMAKENRKLVFTNGCFDLLHVGHIRYLEAAAREADLLVVAINDDAAVMKSLMHGLLMSRVKPYYLYQCDPITGSSHFRTSVGKGLEILAALRGHTTGYAVPTYVIDAPGGGGKIPLLPDAVVGRDGDDLLLRNFEGGVYRYPDPDGTLGAGKGQ